MENHTELQGARQKSLQGGVYNDWAKNEIFPFKTRRYWYICKSITQSNVCICKSCSFDITVNDIMEWVKDKGEKCFTEENGSIETPTE